LESALEEITDAELLQLALEDDRIDLHVGLPAIVEAVNISASKQTVDVTLQLNRAVPNGEGTYVNERLPKLSDVPLGIIVGGGMMISVPVAVGDFGFVHFAERNLSAWRATGAQSDPGDIGMHTLDGAWFSPMIRPDSNALQNADPNNLIIGSDSTPAARIVIKPSGEVDIGAAATNFVAMADKVLTQLNNMATAFNTHTHSGVTTGTGTTGTPSAAMSPGAVASSNLKAND
jgi:Phage protein Gp138 N-terminal domain